MILFSPSLNLVISLAFLKLYTQAMQDPSLLPLQSVIWFLLVFSEKFIKHNIVHKTIPTYSPWYGAAWERLIQTVKHCIYKTVGRNVVDYRNFITILSDIEVAINNRPLTYRDKTNPLEIVTPNHLIRAGNSFPNIVLSEENASSDLDEDNLREPILNSLELRDVMLTRFKKLWADSYLLALRTQHRDAYDVGDMSHNKFLYVGSVVINNQASC